MGLCRALGICRRAAAGRGACCYLPLVLVVCVVVGGWLGVVGGGGRLAPPFGFVSGWLFGCFWRFCFTDVSRETSLIFRMLKYVKNLAMSEILRIFAL